MLRSHRLAVVFLSLSVLTPSLAAAHIQLDVPKVRANSNLKVGPCGDTDAGTPQTLDGWVAGATVTVKFTETIDHPGHFRIALSRTGEAAFMDPDGLDDKTTDGIDLLDNIEDKQEGNNRKATVDVTLPDEPCEDCVLQLIQVMTDKPSAPFYYQCADIVIGPNPNGGGTGGSDAGPSGGSDGSGGATDVGGGTSESAGGALGAGGTGESGGATSGGASSGGASAAGGAKSSGGAPSGSGGVISAGGLAAVSGGASGSDDGGGTGGGGCSVGGPAPGAPFLGLLLSFASLGVRRLSRRAKRTA